MTTPNLGDDHTRNEKFCTTENLTLSKPKIVKRRTVQDGQLELNLLLECDVQHGHHFSRQMFCYSTGSNGCCLHLSIFCIKRVAYSNGARCILHTSAQIAHLAPATLNHFCSKLNDFLLKTEWWPSFVLGVVIHLGVGTAQFGVWSLVSLGVVIIWFWVLTQDNVKNKQSSWTWFKIHWVLWNI